MMSPAAGGETASGESAVWDSQDATETHRTVCPAGGEGGTGRGEVKQRRLLTCGCHGN